MSIPGVRGKRRDPRSVIRQVEAAKWLPDTELERFHGWGVMGLPFASGHLLGLRRWPASSIGPPYTSLWHRAPDGLWTFWSTAEARVSCNRYAGELITRTVQSPIVVSWPGDWTLSVEVEEPSLYWELVLAEPPMARVLNAVAAGLPDRLRRAGGSRPRPGRGAAARSRPTGAHGFDAQRADVLDDAVPPLSRERE